MEETFLTFKKFKDEEVAEALIEQLKEKNIPYELEDSNKFFDPTFAANPLTREIRVKLKSKYFDIARGVVENHYKRLLDDVESDYYLFDFTDQELTEIVMKPG